MDHVSIEPGVTETVKRTSDNLKNHLDWEEWKASGFSHLDATDKDNIFGPTCIIPPGVIVLIQVWTHVVKQTGKSKSRNACDGSPLTGKGFQYAKSMQTMLPNMNSKIFLTCLQLWDI